MTRQAAVKCYAGNAIICFRARGNWSGSPDAPQTGEEFRERQFGNWPFRKPGGAERRHFCRRGYLPRSWPTRMSALRLPGSWKVPGSLRTCSRTMNLCVLCASALERGWFSTQRRRERGVPNRGSWKSGWRRGGRGRSFTSTPGGADGRCSKESDFRRSGLSRRIAWPIGRGHRRTAGWLRRRASHPPPAAQAAG